MFNYEKNFENSDNAQADSDLQNQNIDSIQSALHSIRDLEELKEICTKLMKVNKKQNIKTDHLTSSQRHLEKATILNKNNIHA